MKKKKISLRTVGLINRWNQSKISRTDDWVIIGIQERWVSPNDFCYKFCLFGFDLYFWFRRDFLN